MPQTLLATLALALAALVSYNQQRNSVSNYEAMVQNEIEMAASGTILHIMEFVASRSFDERSTPDGIHARNYLPRYDDDFLAPDQFGEVDRGAAGCELLEPFQTPDCDDVDDVSGIQGQLVTAELSTGRELVFDVDIDVDYVNDATGEVSDDPTRHKRVTVTADSDYLPYGGIALERVVSYDPVKAEMEYEEVHGVLEGGGEPYGNGGVPECDVTLC